MPSFLKNPKFIVGAIVVLWVVYVVSNNLEKSVNFRLLPFNILTLQLRVSAVVVGSALFGALATIVIQFLWKRRSKNAVSTTPGTRTPTPIPEPDSSNLRDSANVSSPALVAAYTDSPATPVRPAIEPTKARYPRPRASIAGSSARVSATGAARFTAINRSRSSTGICAKSPAQP